jgi:hypothetical protein
MVSTSAGNGADAIAPIVITDEMMQAGIDEAKGFPLGADMGDLVRRIYVAMQIEARERQQPAD